MSELLRLRPFLESGLAWDLRELLDLIGAEGERLHWRATYGGESTEFVYRDGYGHEKTMAFWARIDDAENGLPISWGELRELSAQIRQTIWGTFLGFESPDEPDLASLFATDRLYLDQATPVFGQQVSIGLQCVDSSFWLVHAREDDLRERLRRELAG